MELSRLVSNMVALVGDSRVHVAVSAFAHELGVRPRLSALNAQRSTFAHRHLFIQSFYLQDDPGLDLAWRYISRADLRFPYTS
jgi:hypothetical protein